MVAPAEEEGGVEDAGEEVVASAEVVVEVVGVVEEEAGAVVAAAEVVVAEAEADVGEVGVAEVVREEVVASAGMAMLTLEKVGGWEGNLGKRRERG